MQRRSGNENWRDANQHHLSLGNLVFFVHDTLELYVEEHKLLYLIEMKSRMVRVRVEVV
jgi:hypothetical protein